MPARVVLRNRFSIVSPVDTVTVPASFRMKSRSPRLLALLLIATVGWTAAGRAQTAPAAAVSPAGPLDQHTLEKRTSPVLKALKLTDPAKAAAVRGILDSYFQQMAAWHQKVDPQLDTLWQQWGEARSPKHDDEAKAAEIGRQIDAVYAGFRPQHDAFLSRLATELSAGQIDAVKNALTKTPGFKRTYKAYLAIVPQLTDAQKDVIRGKLLAAREEAMDAVEKKEKIALFKKQKVGIQAYINEQGYDWNKSYKAFVAKIRAESKAKKGK